MSERARTALFLAIACGMAGFLVWGMTGLHPFGEFAGKYGTLLSELAPRQRHTTNVVTTVMFDYRALDTLIEEFILFAAATGVSLLLRTEALDERHPPHERVLRRRSTAMSAAVQLTGALMVVLMTAYGFHLIVHGQLTPGGGFQGGMVVGSAIFLLYLTGGFEPFFRLARHRQTELVELIGLSVFLGSGIITLIRGGHFLENRLPLGRPGELLSGGLIPVLNAASGLAVLAATVLIILEFLDQTLMTE